MCTQFETNFVTTTKQLLSNQFDAINFKMMKGRTIYRATAGMVYSEFEQFETVNRLQTVNSEINIG